MQINLKIDMMDRRLKDLVDFIVNLSIYYPDGITKEELLDMVNNVNRIKDVCTAENQEDCYYQAKTFNPKTINGISVEECISRFFILLNGLIDRNVLDRELFIDGCWTNSR